MNNSESNKNIATSAAAPKAADRVIRAGLGLVGPWCCLSVMLNDEPWSCLELELNGVISYKQLCHFLFVLNGLRLSCLFSLPGDIQQNFFVVVVAESVQQFYEVTYSNRLPRLLLTGV